MTDDCEVITVESSSSLFCDTSRPTSGTYRNFLNLFENLSDFVFLNKFQLYMSEDFNIDMSVLSRHEFEFSSFLDSNCFHSIIETSTRITGIS